MVSHMCDIYNICMSECKSGGTSIALEYREKKIEWRGGERREIGGVMRQILFKCCLSEVISLTSFGFLILFSDGIG